MSWDAIADADMIEKLTAENASLRGEMERRACPCLHTTPCHPDCTCANPLMSRGCERCCTYGSPEQQKAAAERLAALTADLARVTGERDAAASSLMAIAQWTEDDGDMNSLRAYARNRSLVAACAPPASGEDG